ncbi:MAG: DoxX family protein [Acidimicrobiia bacterium]|nr:DoxX family protein [Acidimicrobiia bacterium]
MNRALWILQILLGVYFLAVGVMHFIVPDGLPSTMSWMYDLSTGLHVVSGVAEILGGLGLILPAVTGIRPALVPLAATGLALVMAGAIVYHIGRGETQNVVFNVVLIALLGFIAYGRSRLHPHKTRAA